VTVTFLEVTAGTGTRVGFDSDGAGTPQFTQIVKLGSPVLGSNALAAGDITNGIDVDVTRVQGSVAVTDNAGSLTVDAPVGTPVFVRLSDGTAALTTLPVSLASVPSHAVTNAGTFAVQVTSLPASTGTLEVVGDVAQDAPAAGNPVLIGLRASTAIPTAMSGDADSVYGWADRNGAVMVAGRPCATATLANVSGSASSVTLQAANTARKAWSVWNDSTAILYLKFGSTASATSATVKMVADAYYELPDDPVYTGIITGIWVSATGSARVTEITS